MFFASGKVIITGEHAVVYGRPALAAALDRGVSAEAELVLAGSEREQESRTEPGNRGGPGCQATRRRIPLCIRRSGNTADGAGSAAWRWEGFLLTLSVLHIEPWGVHITPSASGEPLSRAFAAALNLYEEPHRVRVRATVGLPPGAGLGCSAALGVAIIGALDEVSGACRSREELACAALEWERVFHGQPSGVDTTMAALGGVGVYSRGAGLTRCCVERPLHFVVGDSGTPSSTRAMLDVVTRRRERDHAGVEWTFEALGALTLRAREAVERGDVADLGAVMDESHALLRSLGVSTPRLDEMCARARAAGALGAKLTGGGGGGCMMALVASEVAVQPVEAALSGLARSLFQTVIQPAADAP